MRSRESIHAQKMRQPKPQPVIQQVAGTEGMGFVDTISLNFSAGPKVSDLVQRAEGLGMRVREGGRGPNIGGRKPWLEVMYRGRSRHIYIELAFPGIRWFKKATVTASRFPTFKDLYLSLRLLFDPHLEFATVTRIDFAVDLFASLEEISRRTWVSYKRHRDLRLTMGSKSSGIYIGKSPSQIKFYDKAKWDPEWAAQYKAETDEEPPAVTRIEVSLTGDRIPIEHLYELPSLFAKTNEGFDPFENINLFDEVAIVPETAVHERRDLVRYIELKTLLNFCGLHFTRKHLNQNRNFLRDYNKFLIYSDNAIPLCEIFQPAIQNYFKGWRPNMRACTLVPKKVPNEMH